MKSKILGLLVKMRRILGGLALLAGGVFVGSGIPPVAAQSYIDLSAIIVKLDEILTAVENSESNHTLRWDSNHPQASRYVLLADFNNEAVLDKNTGLVWERTPSPLSTTYEGARNHCFELVVAGTTGWRLPSIFELNSVRDPSLPPPFVNNELFLVASFTPYWSATFNGSSAYNVYIMHLAGPSAGYVGSAGVFPQKPNTNYNKFHGWCVRGPSQEGLH